MPFFTLSFLASVLTVAPSDGESLALSLAKEKRGRALAEGRPLYMRFCATCHGREGDGKGPSAQFLDFPPRNFLSGEFEFKMTPMGTLAREEDVFRSISVGILGTPMPAWESVLTVAQRRTLARYVMAISDRYLTEQPGQPISIPPEPPNTRTSIARGKAIFEQMGCVACHGETGEGNGAAAGFLMDNDGFPIRPANFTKGYYQGGRGGEVVFRAISTGLAGTPMPSFGDAIPADKRWDLVHYVQSFARTRSILQSLFDDPAGRTQVP